MTVSEKSSEASAASAGWAIEQLTAELREMYLAVASATVLLERTSAGCAHPAIRQARRSGDDALDLAADAERQLSEGTNRLRAEAGHNAPATIAGLVDVLDATRHQLDTAAERIRRLPERITATVRQLADTHGVNQPDPTVETVTGQWSRATEQLTLMAASLSTAVVALSSYTGALSGADAPTA